MSRDSTPRVGVEAGALGLSTPSGFAGLAPELQDQMYRRLGGMGLVYAGGWIATYLFYRTVYGDHETQQHRLFVDTVAAISMAAGVLVWFLCRRRSIPARAFSDFAVGFEILGGLGIYTNAWYWLQHGEGLVLRTAMALGVDGPGTVQRIVEPLQAAGVRLFYAEGVTWVAVWLLVFPLVVPMPMLRTVVGTLLTAAMVPLVLFVSASVQGIPAGVEPWVMPYVIDTTVPTFICAGIAIFGSRVVYRLAQDLSKARRMGNYQLVEKIGIGGMGEVWRAKHRMLARPAAIKLIRPEVLGDESGASRIALKRFEREVQLTTQLSHPHTITIFDYGQTPDGVFYYVMEFLEGINLEQFVRRFGPAPADRVIGWLLQACGSLDEAHARGLIHRDVKPANLYTCRYGLQTDFLKVLDFGLVKGRGPHSDDSTRMTIEHHTIGTPAYMPPEIATGSEADARSDVYALGCVAYWLLTGQTVFEGTTAMEMAVKHARDLPVPPSQRIETGVPADLEAVVLDCLAKDREARPAGARDLARRLERCDDAGRWTSERAERWWEIHLPELQRSEPAFECEDVVAN